MAYQYNYPTVASQLAAMSEKESPRYRRGVAKMTKVNNKDFVLPEDEAGIEQARAARMSGRPMAAAQQPVMPQAAAPVPVAQAATQQSFISQLGEAFGKVAPDMFRGIAAGLASYDGNPLTPYSGVGEAIAATTEQAQRTRNAKRELSLVPAAAEAEVTAEGIIEKGRRKRQEMEAQEDRSAFRALPDAFGFTVGVPTSPIAKSMMAYQLANPAGVRDQNRMAEDMAKRSMFSALPFNITY